MLKKILIALVLIIIAVIIFLNYLSFFSKVEITEIEDGPFFFVYEDHQGPYQNIGPVMDKVYYSLLNEEGIKTSRGMGIYYDNPQTTPSQNLRSQGGSLLEEADLNQLQALKDKYKIMSLEKGKYLKVDFPYKNKLSIMLGVIKVYPAISQYVSDHKYEQKEMIEIYDQAGGKISYLMGL